MATNADVIKTAYQAFTDQDIPTFLGLLDADIDWYIPDELPDGGLYRGPDGVLQFFGKLTELYTEFHVEPDRFLSAGEDTVLVEGRHRGRIGDRTFDIGFAHLWTLRDGVVIAFREYCDSAKFLELFAADQAAPVH